MNLFRFVKTAALGSGLVLATSLSAAPILVDFGLVSSTTASPDGNGNHWVNVTGNGDDEVDMTDADGNPTTVDLTITTDFTGPNNPGGLASPDASLLGDFAIPTVTSDYLFFTDGLTPQITLGGLDPSKTYDLSFFATRDTSGTRTTTYTVAAVSQTLQTSGSGAGSAAVPNGNDDTVVTLAGLAPTAGG